MAGVAIQWSVVMVISPFVCILTDTWGARNVAMVSLLLHGPYRHFTTETP